MACKRYNVSVQPGRFSGFIQYLQCNTLNRIDRPVSPQSPILLTDVETILNTVSVIVEELQSTPTPTPPPQTTRYYELVPCNNQLVSLYTTRPPSVIGERVSVSNGSDVGVSSSISWIYNGITESATIPGTLATAVIGTGRSGCVDTPPPTPTPTPPPPPDFTGDLYEIASCNTGQRLFTSRPPAIPSERATIATANSGFWVYTGEILRGRVPVGLEIATGVQGTGRVGCSDTLPTPTPTPTPTRRVDFFYTIQSCTNSTDRRSTTRFPRFTNERVLLGSATYRYTGETTTRVRGGSILTERDLSDTGAVGCPSISVTPTPTPTGGGGGGGGILITPPPTPTTVDCSIAQVVSPNLESLYNELCSSRNFRQSDFVPGEILLDGVVIGRGNVTRTLRLGQSYTIEFRKPSHPLFTFSSGSPTKYEFTATSSTTRFESVFRPSFVANTGTLTVNTSYNPSIAGSTKPLSIYIEGKGKIGEGSVENYELEPGQYTVYFEAAKVPGMVFITPPKQKVTIRVCETTEVDVSYDGLPLPTNYWLKPIDDAEKTQYNAVLTKGMFSNNIANLVRFYTSSISDSLDNHYTHVYHEPISYPTSSIQFSVAYGNVNGSGSNDEGGQYNDTPTRAIYGQYRNIILGSATDKLNLSGTPTDHFYLISYQKDRRDTRADYNALEINLAHLSGSEFTNGEGFMAAHTGSNVKLGGEGKVLRLISDYKINDNPQRAVPSAPLEYNIVSGSIEDGVYNSDAPHYYGKLYPSLGVVLLDANKTDISASFGTVTSREIDGKNQLKLFTAISGAAQYTDVSGDFLGMKARATKEELIYYYYINVNNKEFNYSNNPTIYNTEGLKYLQYGIPSNIRISSDILDNTAVINEDLRANPKTYITTIGLYDDNRNLIAVAKVSQAELKSFTDEVMFTVKLKF